MSCLITLLLSCLLPVVLSSMFLVNHVNFPNWGVAAMLFPYSSLCSIMLKNTVQLCQLHALAKSALGTKERRKKNNQNGYQTQIIPQKKCSKIPVIDFDPRPRTCRQVSAHHISDFVRDLQPISMNINNISIIYIYNDYPQDPTMDIAWVVGLA